MNSDFEDVLREVREQHPEETPEEQLARARYRIEQHVDRRPHKPAPAARRAPGLPWWAIAWAIAVLLLLGAIAAKAEPDERLRLIHRAMESAEPQQPSGLILQLRNQGTVLTTRPAGLLILNCSTNMSCSMTGSTFNITSSSTASTAFSALTASLNTNVGTFSASGNSWDFTAATIFKLRASAALTTSAAGDLGYDTTAGRWHGFIGAADRLFIGSTNVGAAGQAALSNADGTFTFADPIVSGPAAEGAAPVNNPVWVAGKGADGFIHSVRMANDGTVRTDPTGTTTQPISAASLPLPSGAAQEHTTAASPHATRLTDGTAFYKATTPADTQPVSGTVTANAGTGTFTNQQTNVTEDYDTGAGTQNVTKFGIALPASGGSVAGGTSTNPLRVDPTGTTTQPIRGVGAVVADSTAVRCVNAANTAFESCAGAGGSGGTSSTDQAAFTAGTTSGTPAMGARDDTTPSTLAEDTLGIARMTANRGLHVNLRNASGTELGDATTPVRMDPTGTTTQPVSGTVTANAGTGTFTVGGTVTANIGTSGSLALDASVTGLQVTQGSTTTGQKGELIQGAVTTSAPTYTTGQTNPLSLTTAGGLRIDGSGVTQPVSGTVTANQGTAAALSGAWPVKLTDGTNTAPTMDVAARAGFEKITDGTNVAIVDPCQDSALTRAAFNISQTAGAQLITGTASKQTYICDLFYVTATAQNIALVEGTGTVCATGAAGMAGGATAATGQNWAANQGFVKPATGYWQFKTATAADNVCLLQSGTGQISGGGSYVQK